MNKKMIIILSVLVLFLIIGGVSASETNMTDEKVSTADIHETVSSTNEVNMTDELSVRDVVEENINNNEGVLKIKDDSSNLLQSSNDNEKLAASSIDVSTFSQLSSAISNGAYSEINIKSNIVFTNYLSITRSNLIINGNGFTFDGQNKVAIFTVVGSSSNNLHDITIKNINRYCLKLS